MSSINNNDTSYHDYIRKRRELVLRYTLQGYNAAEIIQGLKQHYPEYADTTEKDIYNDRFKAEKGLKTFVQYEYLPKLGVYFAKAVKMLDLINENCWLIVNTSNKARDKIQAMELLMDVSLELIRLKDSTQVIENMDIIIKRYDDLRTELNRLKKRAQEIVVHEAKT